jgi:hypothetical protein
MAEVASYSRRRAPVKFPSSGTSGSFPWSRRSEPANIVARRKFGFVVEMPVLPRVEVGLARSRQHGLFGIEYDLACARRRGEVELGLGAVGEHAPQKNLLA